jgi:hypothetical protein
VTCRTGPPKPLWLLASIVLGLLTRAQSKAENRWPDERQAGHFLCHADFPLAPKQPLLDELAQLQQDLGTKLGAPLPKEKVHFFLFQAKD